APAISHADDFTWDSWWRQVFRWLRLWLKGAVAPGPQTVGGPMSGPAAVAEQRSIRALYRELLGLVARAGFERQPSTTPNELARTVTSARPTSSPAIRTMTDLYVRVRY